MFQAQGDFDRASTECSRPAASTPFTSKLYLHLGKVVNTWCFMPVLKATALVVEATQLHRYLIHEAST